MPLEDDYIENMLYVRSSPAIRQGRLTI
jgi:hypothetical protein